jgi:hypothetical protein
MATTSASEAATSLVLLNPLERRVILYLRLHRSGRRGRAEVEQDIAARLGSGTEQALGHVERLERLISHAVSRPLDLGSMADVRATRDERIVAKLLGIADDRRSADRLLSESGIAALVNREQLMRAISIAAGIIARETAPRCSCGRTSADHDPDRVCG